MHPCEATYLRRGLELATRSRTWTVAIKLDGCDQTSKFVRFVAAQGDMRSELRVCGLARTDHRRGRWRVHRDTDRQQLRLLARGRRLHHACGHQGLIGFSALLAVFRD
jgi:hypothetical protein